MIEKKLKQMGNSWGVIIPKALIQALGINPVADKIGITIENNKIVMKKVENTD